MVETKTPTRDRREMAENPHGLASLGVGEIAYIRTVQAKDVAEEVPQAREMAPETTLFALYGASGEPIMLATTRELAVMQADEHELTTLSVH